MISMQHGKRRDRGVRITGIKLQKGLKACLSSLELCSIELCPIPDMNEDMYVSCACAFISSQQSSDEAMHGEL